MQIFHMTGRVRLVRLVVSALAVTVAGCGEPGTSTDEAVTQRTGALHGTATLNFVKTADWGSGYNARVDITNAGAAPIQTWSAELDMPKNVQVNVSGLPACGPGVSGDCWQVFSDIGPENILRIFRLDSSNIIGVGQTASVFLFGSYEGVFGPPTRCRAPHTDTPVGCNGSNADVTAPTAPVNVRFLGTGSTIADLLWNPATDNVGVTGYIIRYATRAAPALEISEVPATTPVTRVRLSRLVSDTDYTFFVEARDAAGNVSPLASSPITHTAVPNITAVFVTTNTWPGGGFQGEFRVTNNESVPLDNWRIRFTFTGSFQSVWDGVLRPEGGSNTFNILAPAHNITLSPGETAVVGATGTFGNPATPPSIFEVGAGDPLIRPLATPQPPCLGLMCPSGTQCGVLPNGFPTCI